jgi:hypothetical protein
MSGCSSSFALGTRTPFSLGFFSSSLQNIAKILAIKILLLREKRNKKKHVSIRERVYCTLETTGGGGGGGGGSGGGDGTVWETEGGAAAACGEAIIIIFLFGFCFYLLYIKQFVIDL